MQAALVRVADDRSEQPAASQFLTFTLASELCAVPIAKVKEVVEYQGITRIPLAPPCVPGVLNLRGSVIPIVDLAIRLGRAPSAFGRRTCVVVVEMKVEEGTESVGVIVDSVSEALEVDPTQLEQRPTFGAGLRSDFVAGMLKLDGQFIVVLDMDVVLSHVELEQLVSSGGRVRELPESTIRAESASH